MDASHLGRGAWHQSARTGLGDVAGRTNQTFLCNRGVTDAFDRREARGRAGARLSRSDAEPAIEKVSEVTAVSNSIAQGAVIYRSPRHGCRFKETSSSAPRRLFRDFLARDVCRRTRRDEWGADDRHHPGPLRGPWPAHDRAAPDHRGRAAGLRRSPRCRGTLRPRQRRRPADFHRHGLSHRQAVRGIRHPGKA